MASFVAMMLLASVAGLLISRLSLPPVPLDAAAGPARPLAEIARQPVFLAALISSAVAFSVMVMVMTATPLAMQTCGHSLGAAASVAALAIAAHGWRTRADKLIPKAAA